MKRIFSVLLLCFLLLYSGISLAQEVNGKAAFSWKANTEADLAGYKMYYGEASKVYSNVIDVNNVIEYTVGGLEIGKTYFFAVTAYDMVGNESGFSSEVSAKGQDQDAPEAPVDFKEKVGTLNIQADVVNITQKNK